MTACMTFAGPKISALELEDDKFGSEDLTQDGRSELLMSGNSHGSLSMMKESL